jgi:phage antirepressor YoqD-like protein
MARGSSSKTDEIVAALKAQQDAERALVTKLAARWETTHRAIEQAEAALAAAKQDYVDAVAEWAASTSAASVAKLTGLPARTVSEYVNAAKRTKPPAAGFEAPPS